MKMVVVRHLIGFLLLALVLGGCRGQTSDKPPIHLNPNMDRQLKYMPQAESAFFPDRRTMRVPPEGTVARGFLREDDALYRGKDGDKFINYIPLEVDMALMKRGQERFNIYCSPCHDRTGSGKGMVARRGLVPPPSFYSKRVMKFRDGQFFDIITNGVRSMPSYRHQIPVKDRWAIVAYIRALQLSRNAPKEIAQAAQ